MKEKRLPHLPEVLTQMDLTQTDHPALSPEAGFSSVQEEEVGCRI